MGLNLSKLTLVLADGLVANETGVHALVLGDDGDVVVEELADEERAIGLLGRQLELRVGQVGDGVLELFETALPLALLPFGDVDGFVVLVGACEAGRLANAFVVGVGVGVEADHHDGLVPVLHDEARLALALIGARVGAMGFLVDLDEDHAISPCEAGVGAVARVDAL